MPVGLVVVLLYAWAVTRFFLPNRAGLAYALSAAVSIVLGCITAWCVLAYIMLLAQLNGVVAKSAAWNYGVLRTCFIVFLVLALLVLLALLFFAAINT